MLPGTCLLLAFSFLYLTSAQDAKGDDITNNGNYLIARCGKGIPGGKAEQLISLFREIGADLTTILVEANTGVDSSYGFKALFTSDQAIVPVTANFEKLSDSATVQVNGQTKQITFVCAEPDDPGTSEIYNYAMRNQPRACAFSQFGTEKIFLMPLFFSNEYQRNPAPYRCPLFRMGSIARHADDILGTTQYGTIIHELLDKYMHLEGMQEQEKYDLIDCIKLRPEQQLLNAENYAMFASGEMSCGCV